MIIYAFNDSIAHKSNGISSRSINLEGDFKLIDSY